jgi:hypothetical protein
MSLHRGNLQEFCLSVAYTLLIGHTAIQPREKLATHISSRPRNYAQ